MTISSAPTIAIVILNWNGWEDTIECLTSLKNLTYPNWKAIVVDNNSTDGSAQKIQQTFPDVTLINNNSNLGFSEGNNVGIREALRSKADYIFILNNDTILDPPIFSYLLAESEKLNEPAILSPRIFSYTSPQEISFGGARWLPDKAKFLILQSSNTSFSDEDSEAFETGFALGCAMFFNRLIPEQIGLFEKKFFLHFEDMDWCNRARKAGIPIFHVPKAKLWHKISSTFERETSKGTSHYYCTRNHLLWIEKHLKSTEKRIAYTWVLKQMFKQIKKSLNPMTTSALHRKILKSQGEGLLHYLIRVFGQRPSDRK